MARSVRVVAKEIERLAVPQTDRCIAIWLQVRHGARRMTEVAKENGYRDSSGVYRVVRRFEARAKEDEELARQLRSSRSQLSNVRS